MAGANPKGSSSSSSIKPSSSQPNHRKSRWESSATNKSDHPRPSNNKLPSPKPPPPAPTGFFPPPPYNNNNLDQSGSGPPFPDPSGLAPPPPPAYGFHMLERRTIALADGSVRSYFALPHDYQDPPPLGPGVRGGMMMSPEGGGGFRRGTPNPNEYWNSLGLDGRDGRGPMPPPPEAGGMLKRKFGEVEERDEFARQRQQLLQYGNPNAGTSNPTGFVDDMRPSNKHMRMYDSNHNNNVDQQVLKRAFLQFVKLIYENTAKKNKFLENGKQGSLECLVCGRASKEFPDMHSLIMHVHGPHSGDLHVDHLGLHKALCVLMGWNHAKVPDNSKVYQSLPANEAEANKEDLILWPPLVIIHNTNTGKSKDGRMDGLGNRVMDIKLKDLGFGGGKAKSLYGKEGHLGITLVKFAPDQSGLKEAARLAEYFEKDYHGRKGWARAQQPGIDDETNPNLVNLDEINREDRRILYGYLATVLDLEKVDFETKKRVSIESKRELKP